MSFVIDNVKRALPLSTLYVNVTNTTKYFEFRLTLQSSHSLTI